MSENEQGRVFLSRQRRRADGVGLLSRVANHEDLALLVSVNASTRNGFAEIRSSLGLRAALNFESLAGPRHDLRLNAVGASRAAEQIATDVHRVREQLNAKGAVHMFFASPVGLAFLLGTQMNKVGKVIVYEYEDGPNGSRYVQGVELSPSR